MTSLTGRCPICLERYELADLNPGIGECQRCIDREREAHEEERIKARRDRMATKIKWGRSDDGWVRSHCGRWVVSPNFHNTSAPASYSATDRGKLVADMRRTQKAAKDACQSDLDSEMRRQPPHRA